MTPSDIEAMFFQYVPERFVQRALRMVYDARRRSWDHCASEFPTTEADNVRPWWTRGKVEASLRDVADLHADDGVSYRVVKTPKSGWNHTEILAGRVLLTAGAVQSPCGPVNKADFRLGLAASNQGTLFDDEEAVRTHLYVMLLHSGYRSMDRVEQSKYGHLPASVYLAFPSSDLDSYLHEINLIERYPAIVRANLPEEWDQEAVVRYMREARRTSWAA